jgi:hypothetical protein
MMAGCSRLDDGRMAWVLLLPSSAAVLLAAHMGALLRRGVSRSWWFLVTGAVSAV